MVERETRELIENLDEEKLMEMIEAEGEIASSRENRSRVQKKLLDDLGLFDVDLDEFDISRDLRNRIERLKYVNVDSNVEREHSEETKRAVRERFRELGLDPDSEG